MRNINQKASQLGNQGNLLGYEESQLRNWETLLGNWETQSEKKENQLGNQESQQSNCAVWKMGEFVTKLNLISLYTLV